MTRAQRQFGLMLQNSLRERAEIDPVSTKEFINGLAKTLRPVGITKKK